ncbi:YqgE/AlgH family protein [Shewanella sp. OPT22]|uniref:YqgE/AlgH family protein n=1 Tax=Parashewanella hymeniacidonis TaxID=2807618 RepID=UPI00101EFD32|nr:YqgE/AlgH family protein [Parashewanella hymeniacidonis]MBM7072137.1 YqgE/AlgH family protein [Parashewanella hymeniacidonis]RYV01183.1 YqgE/AlgH family protein [Shewanella sp. OPT22]
MDSLQNYFLVAMPELDGTFFERSVIFICEHDEKGAMGIIINRPIGIEVSDLLEQMDLSAQTLLHSAVKDSPVLVGGPVSPDRGFVLHSNQNGWTNSLSVSDDLMITTSRDVLSAMGKQKGPDNFIVALGYAGWSKDQLEEEISSNSWLTIPATSEIMFDIEPEKRWQMATTSLGFESWQVSSQVGHS